MKNQPIIPKERPDNQLYSQWERQLKERASERRKRKKEKKNNLKES
jgi:hypothetical protein